MRLIVAPESAKVVMWKSHEPSDIILRARWKRKAEDEVEYKYRVRV